MDRATIRYSDKYIVFLCPVGHVIEAHKCDRDFAGSAFEAELGAWQSEQPNRFDRLAAKCNGAGHEKAEAHRVAA